MAFAGLSQREELYKYNLPGHIGPGTYEGKKQDTKKETNNKPPPFLSSTGRDLDTYKFTPGTI